MILEISPRASAALSRRCLENLLRKKAPIKSDTRRITKLIDETIESKTLPADLAELLHYVREIGDFSAHPIKDEHTDIIINVSKEEAELNLEVIQRLFDFYFVQPAKNIAIKKKLDEKIQKANRNFTA